MHALLRVVAGTLALLAVAVAGCGSRTGLLVPPPAHACDPTTCVAGCNTSSGPGPVERVCVQYPASGDSGDECDGHHDAPGFAPNGATGNGFDDNCNGLVDEGCACEDVGTTKTCYLVPASQTVNGAPVGWCAQNSKGTVDCVQHGAGALWSGQCRGARPPLLEDICSPGDYNCDGKDENPPNENCACQTAVIACPTAPLVTIPYPPPAALPLQVDASAWFSDPSQAAAVTDWRWSLTGGDCDNILPHPSFGVYAGSDGTGDPVSKESDTLGPTMTQHGVVAQAPAVRSTVFPAFSLSGDYVLDATWTYDGQPYSCSIKVEVRAPGLRAEGCWSTEALGDDLDLHMAKASNFPACSGQESWSDLSPDSVCASANEDCYYNDCITDASMTDWGYPASPPAACAGWGSQATDTQTPCANPRLDRDANGVSGTCDPTVTNPNGSMSGGPFCGSENINLDNPADGDVFAVAMRFYAQTSSTNPQAHVNIYCNGARVLSTGYDPVSKSNFPQMIESGADSAGDMWKVALVTTQMSAGTLTCEVMTTPSKKPDPLRDGSSAYCVDNAVQAGPDSQALLTPSGAAPTTAADLCFH